MADIAMWIGYAIMAAAAIAVAASASPTRQRIKDEMVRLHKGGKS